MASAIEKSLAKSETRLTLLKVLAENSFDSIGIKDRFCKRPVFWISAKLLMSHRTPKKNIALRHFL